MSRLVRHSVRDESSSLGVYQDLGAAVISEAADSKSVELRCGLEGRERMRTDTFPRKDGINGLLS